MYVNNRCIRFGEVDNFESYIRKHDRMIYEETRTKKLFCGQRFQVQHELALFRNHVGAVGGPISNEGTIGNKIIDWLILSRIVELS